MKGDDWESTARRLEIRVRSNRAESLERHGEVQAMLVELTGVQQSMKEVIQHLEDRLEKVQRQVLKALEMARQARDGEATFPQRDQEVVAMCEMCEEAQRMYHEKAADLAKAEHLMKEARLEAEEAIQLRWCRPTPTGEVMEMREVTDVRADVLRLSSLEACTVSEEIGQKVHLEMQEVAEAIESISSEHRVLQKEAMLEMRSHHRALARDLIDLEKRIAMEARQTEATMATRNALHLTTAEEYFAEQAAEVAELAVAGAARCVAESLAEAEQNGRTGQRGDRREVQ